MVVLPAPFGPEEREDLAAGDLEVDAPNRLQLAVGLVQAAGSDHRLGHDG